jgi:outer membrane protein assembly factor BamB
MRTLPALLLALVFAPAALADDWPQWMGPHRDGVWTETGIVDRLPQGGPKVLWRIPVAGGYSGPAVADGRVYLLDYARAAGDNKPNPIARNKLKGKERVLCVRAADGKPVWTHAYDCSYAISYPAGPRCTPTVHAGKVYTLGAMGNLLCLDAAKGKVLWSKDFPKDFGAPVPLWGFCGHPLVDGQKLICIVGGKGTAAMAFDKDTGKELWRSLSSKETGYSAPVIIKAGGVRQLLIWTGEALNSLNPDTGKSYWSFPLATYMGMSIMTPRQSGDYLFAGAVYGTAVGLKLDPDKPAAFLAWRGKNAKGTGLFPTNMTPFAEDGILYGVDQPGEFRAVKAATGERLWESWRPLTGKDKSPQVPTGTIFVVKNADRFFLFTEKGELVISQLSPKGYKEVSRWKMLEPTGNAFGRPVVWSHPAFANCCIYARNDKELVCASLAK